MPNALTLDDRSPRLRKVVGRESPRVTSTEEPDGGNLLVRIWRGAGVGNLPAYSTTAFWPDVCESAPPELPHLDAASHLGTAFFLLVPVEILCLYTAHMYSSKEKTSARGRQAQQYTPHPLWLVVPDQVSESTCKRRQQDPEAMRRSGGGVPGGAPRYTVAKIPL